MSGLAQAGNRSPAKPPTLPMRRCMEDVWFASLFTLIPGRPACHRPQSSAVGEGGTDLLILGQVSLLFQGAIRAAFSMCGVVLRERLYHGSLLLRKRTVGGLAGEPAESANGVQADRSPRKFRTSTANAGIRSAPGAARCLTSPRRRATHNTTFHSNLSQHPAKALTMQEIE